VVAVSTVVAVVSTVVAVAAVSTEAAEEDTVSVHLWHSYPMRSICGSADALLTARHEPRTLPVVKRRTAF